MNAYWVDEGQIMAGPYPATPDAAGTRDRLRTLSGLGISHYVDLTEAGELNHEGVPLRDYRSMLDETGSLTGTPPTHWRMPIRDEAVPTVEQMRAILDRLSDCVDSGGITYVHCWGGTGRTGTVMGCWLIETGFPPERVIARIAELRVGIQKAWRPSPHNRQQVEFVRNWLGSRSR